MLDGLVVLCLCSQAVIFNEGDLVLDDCDFSESSASVLVFTDPATSHTTVRNAILGDLNCELPSWYNNTIKHKIVVGGGYE